MSGIERPEILSAPNANFRNADRDLAREDGRRGNNLASGFGAGGMPSRDSSGKSAKDNLESRGKAFELALRASGAKDGVGSKGAVPGEGDIALEGRGKRAEDGRWETGSDGGRKDEEAIVAVVLARAGPEQGPSAGRASEIGQPLSSDLSQRIDALARKVSDQIDGQLRVSLIGGSDRGFSLRVAIEDPAMGLKSITVRADGDLLSISLHVAQDVLDRETLATLAGQLATTLATRFPRRTIEISGLEVTPRPDGAEEPSAAAQGPVGLQTLFAKR